MVPQGGKIVVKFLGGFNEIPGTEVSCSPIYGFDGDSAKCLVNDDGNIELEEAFPTVDFLVIFTV